MNNSLERLFNALVSTIERQIIPSVSDDFARGQAYGVIYMLRWIGKRTAWSADYLQPQIAALQATLAELDRLLAGHPEASNGGHAELPGQRHAAQDLVSQREEMNCRVCASYDWVESHRQGLPENLVQEVRATLANHLTMQLKAELRHNVALNFSEISTGHASTRTDTVRAS